MRFALLLMMVVSSAESAEPMLDGKTLKQWAALLSSGKPKDREEAAFALAEMGKTVPEAIPYLIRALKTGTSRSRMSAVEALGNLGTKAESAIPALKSLVLKTNSKKIRAQMLEVLHKISGASEKWTEERLNAFGLEVNEPQAILIAQLDLPKGQGLAVTQILEGSKAESSGLKQHDILLEVGGNEIPSALPDFLKLMESLKGKAFDFSVMRGGRFITVKGIKFPSWTPQPVVESGPRKETYSVRVRSDVFMGYYHGSAGRIIVQGRLENNKPAPTKISIYFDNFRQQFTDINDIPQKYRKFVRKLLPIGGLR